MLPQFGHTFLSRSDAAVVIVCVRARAPRRYQRTGAGGAVKSVVRAIPIAVLRPLIGAAEAASQVALGVRNEMDPEVRADMHL